MTEYAVEPPGGRLDAYLANLIVDISRTSIQAMIRNGSVRVNGVVVVKPAFELHVGDAVEVSVEEAKPTTGSSLPIPLDVVFENADYMVINKPAGVVVHPAPGHDSGTLVDAAVARVPEIKGLGESGREGLVHRLDKDTSGLIVMAKNEATLLDLQHQFMAREITKTYLAVVDGAPPSRMGRVEAPIARDPRQRQRFSVQEGGRPAITEFAIRERYDRHALVEAKPVTGRTHQIRIHMSFLECPIVGDKVYGRTTASLDVARQMLHAWKLKLPDRGKYEVEVPEDFSDALRQAAG